MGPKAANVSLALVSSFGLISPLIWISFFGKAAYGRSSAVWLAFLIRWVLLWREPPPLCCFALISRSSSRTEGRSSGDLTVPSAVLLCFFEVGADGWDFSAAFPKEAFLLTSGFCGARSSFFTGAPIKSSSKRSSASLSGFSCSGAEGVTVFSALDFSISRLIETVSTAASLKRSQCG